jgi:hypothetical protein
MVGWESSRTWVGRDVGETQQRRFANEDAEDASPVRQFADCAPLLLAEPTRDEVAEVGSARGQDSQRSVTSVGQVDRLVDNPLEERWERQLCGQGQPSFEQARSPVSTQCHPIGIIVVRFQRR